MALAVKAIPLRRVRGLVSSRHLTHNAIVLGGNLGAGFFGYLLHAVLGHLLGPASYGTVTALIALSSILLFPTQVVGLVIAKDVAILETADAVGQINDRLRRLTCILLPIGLIITCAVVVASGPIARFLNIGTIGPVLMLAPLFTVALLAPINSGVFQGRRQYGAYATFIVVPVALRVLLSCGLVLAGFGIGGAILGVTLSMFTSYLMSFVPLRRVFAACRMSSGSLRPLASSAMTTSIALGCAVILYNLDTVLAKHLLPDRPAGLYAALATVGKVVLVVGTSIIAAAFPRFVAVHAHHERPNRILAGVIVGVVVLSLCVELPFVFVPALVMRIAVGPAFLPVASQLAWYGLAMVLYAVAQVFIFYFLATDARLFSLAVFGCCAVQVIAFELRHHAIGDLVLGVLVSKILLLLALLVLFARQHRCSERGASA